MARTGFELPTLRLVDTDRDLAIKRVVLHIMITVLLLHEKL